MDCGIAAVMVAPGRTPVAAHALHRSAGRVAPKSIPSGAAAGIEFVGTAEAGGAVLRAYAFSMGDVLLEVRSCTIWTAQTPTPSL